MTDKTDPDKPAETAAAQDYRAAMNEIRSNLDVRRLMLVVSHVLVPALAMAMSDCLSGSDYPEELAWLPRCILPIVGATLAVSGLLTTGILARCHFGLVVNGAKIERVRRGEFQARPLNWLGVTTNFVALTALSSGAGTALLLATLVDSIIAIAAAISLVVLLLLYLRVTHWRANRLARNLAPSWMQGDVPTSLEEEHARLSLDATTSDISVVVTMGIALFVGAFNSLTNIGAIPESLQLAIDAHLVRQHGVTVIASFAVLSLLLSGRMVVRLRLALAEHSAKLARLRDESDTPYRFSPRERTYLFYLLQLSATCVCALIAGWSISGPAVGAVLAAVVGAIGALSYPWRLRRAAAAMGG